MSFVDHRIKPQDLLMTRRQMLGRMGSGFASLGLAGLMAREGLLSSPAIAAPLSGPNINPLAPKPPQLPAKAKRVIFLFMNGGPSQVDTFDPKPELTKQHGKPLPYSNLP